MTLTALKFQLVENFAGGGEQQSRDQNTDCDGMSASPRRDEEGVNNRPGDDASRTHRHVRRHREPIVS